MNVRRLSYCSVAAVCIVIGCAEPKIPDPSPQSVQNALSGQGIELNGKRVKMLPQHVTEFQLVEVIHNAEGKTGSAIVRFRYAAGSRAYEVDGVLSFLEETPGAVATPYFEANEVRSILP